MTGCPYAVDVDLADEEPPNDTLTPHAFVCELERGHDGAHSATVTWFEGEE